MQKETVKDRSEPKRRNTPRSRFCSTMFYLCSTPDLTRWNFLMTLLVLAAEIREISDRAVSWFLCRGCCSHTFLPLKRSSTLNQHFPLGHRRSRLCFFFQLHFLSFFFFGAFSSYCRRVSKFTYRYRLFIKWTLQHYRKCNLMLNCILLFPFVSVWSESLSGGKIRTRPVLFCFFQKSWFRWRVLIRKHHVTMLILMHQVLFFSLLPVAPPQPALILKWQHSRGKKKPSWYLLWYFEKLVPFFCFCLRANEKWKKQIIFLYLLEKII